MSDSDDNLTQHNMFENENTILQGQGSFFNQRFKNLVSSTHTSMLQNFNTGYSFNRSMLPVNRRETSPMSLRSVPDFGHNYENSYYSRGRACASIVNGRSQSPGSVGSMDSTTSAVYVAQIFKNMKFNKYDKRIIHEAYNKYFRNRERRRVGKRRKLKLFIKRNRRKSDDSGDDGSNSSMSSDDNRSVRSAIPKESILRPSSRSNRAEILNFRETMKKSDMYTDCTENIRNSSLKNMFNDNYVKPALQLTNNLRDPRKDCSAINSIPQKANSYRGNMEVQRDRFAKGFVLPSERFNKSVMRPANRSMLPHNLQKNSQNPRSDDSDSENDDIFPNQTVLSVNTSRKRTLENHETTLLSSEKRNKLSCDVPAANTDDLTFKKPQLPVRRPIKSKPNFLSGPIASKSKYPLLGFLSHSMSKDSENVSNSTKKPNEAKSESDPVQKWVETHHKPVDSDNDDIFTPNTLTNNNKQQIPDPKDKNDNKMSAQNKPKRGRPPNSSKKKSQKHLCNNSPQDNQVKSAPIEPTTEEILISKSKQPLTGNVEIINAVACNSNQPTKQNVDKGSENISDNPLSVTDMSMKPSFIKRKLFTQKLDIADDKNASIDSLAANSPHPTTYKLREKNKVRKLATSQSCLSRDVAGGDNILDLIHKIVPANQMNMTSATNQKARNSQDNEDRWDVTSVISMCNKTNESDTFTDEDIFHVNATNTSNKVKKNQTKKMNEKQTVDKVNLQRNIQEPVQEIDYTNDMTTNRTNKRTVARCVNAYWDTDFETDLEESMRLPVRSPARNIGRIRETEARNKEYIHRNNEVDTKPSNIKSDCKVVISRHKEEIKSDNIVTKLSEKKDGSANKRVSPKKDKFVKTKEVSNAKQDNKFTKLLQKSSEPVKGLSPKKDVKTKEVNNAKKDKDTKLLNNKDPAKKRLSPKKDKNVEKDKENKLAKLSEEKGVSVKKGKSPKFDKKQNGKRNITKDMQKPVIEKEKNDIKTRVSPRTPRVGVKNGIKKGDTKLNKNEQKIQSKNNTKVLQENKIIGTIKTRKQKSFLNDSLNSSCERSIFTRSFTLQSKQTLL